MTGLTAIETLTVEDVARINKLNNVGIKLASTMECLRDIPLGQNEHIDRARHAMVLALNELYLAVPPDQGEVH